MIYSLDLYIMTDNSGLRNAVKAVLPASNHATVWETEYEVVEGTNFDGNDFLRAEIRFNTSGDRTAVCNSVKGLVGIVDACEVGSYVREHRCYHDEIPPKPCEVETMLEKV